MQSIFELVEAVMFDKIFFVGMGMRKLLLLVHLFFFFNDTSDFLVIIGF